MLPFIIEYDGRVDRWTILSGRSLSRQIGQLKKRQPADDKKQGIPNEEISNHLFGEEKIISREKLV